MSLAEAVKSALGPLVAERERLALDVEKLDRAIHSIETLDADRATPATPPVPFVCEQPGCGREFATSQARRGHMSSHVMRQRRQQDLDTAIKADKDARIVAAWHLEHDLPAPAGEELGIALSPKPEPVAPPHDPPGPMPPPVEDDDIIGLNSCRQEPSRFTPAPWPKSFAGRPEAALIRTGLPPKPVDVDQARARAYDTPENEIKNQ